MRRQLADTSLLPPVAIPAGRFMAEGARRCRIGAGGDTAAAWDGAARFLGRNVLLAAASQLETAAALVQLEGVARRIVLWPAGEPDYQMADTCARAGVDTVVREWTLPGPGAEMPALAPPEQGSASARRPATQWVLRTSGTAGPPKLVVHTLQSLAGHLRAPGPGHGAVWCTFYDIRRYGGLQVFLRAALHGGSLQLGAPGQPFDALLEAAESARATHFLGTPSHWRKVLMSTRASNLRPTYVRLSGEIADQAILDRLRRAYPEAAIVHAFAATEAGLAFEVADGRAGVPPTVLEEAARRGIDIRVADGVLRLRSPGMAQGYLTADGIGPVVDGDGFVDTGDLLALHDGRLFFEGRRDDVVNIGGRKVHPARVEAVLNSHPAVRLSRVLGRASAVTGALVSAEIVRQTAGEDTDARALEASLRAFCREHLAPHEVPASIRCVASLDLARSGKLARRLA